MSLQQPLRLIISNNPPSNPIEKHTHNIKNVIDSVKKRRTIPQKVNVEEPNPKMKHDTSFIKIRDIVRNNLGSRLTAELFERLYYRFQVKPDGFWKFQSPSISSRPGDSLSEEMRLTKRWIRQLSKRIVKSYKSKSLYIKAVNDLGEVAVFEGMPYLSYSDKRSGKTYYLQNKPIVDEITCGQPCGKVCGQPVDTSPTVGEHNSLTIGERCVPYVGEHNSPTLDSNTKPSKAETTLSKNTLQRIHLFLNTTHEISPSKLVDAEQPEEKSLNKVILSTEQPGESVELSIVNDMLKIWREVLERDLESSPSKKTFENLKSAYVNDFGSSIKKWADYCELLSSSKYLMGETDQKFLLKISVMSTAENIAKVHNGHFTTGDRVRMIYLEPLPINDPDPEVLKFKRACLANMEKNRYKSWIEPMGIKRNASGEMVCMAPTPFFAEYVAANDSLGFGYFIESLGIPAVVIMNPKSNKPAGTLTPCRQR